jgi:Protein of unknown function (DUF2950)
MAVQLAGLPRPTAKRLPVKIRDRPETGRKPAHAMSHRVGQSLVRTTVAQAGEIDLPRVAVEIALAIEACRPVRTRGLVAAHWVATAAVRRAPAVPAAVPVWVGAAAVAADGGGKGTMTNEKRMRVQEKTLLGVILLRLVPCVLALLVLVAFAFAQEAKSTQKTFATPEQAAAALIQASETFDVPALTKILGPDGEDLVSSEDPVRDKRIAAEFAAKAHEHTSISVDPNNANRATLLVGNDNFPLAIPIIHKNGTWFFDTKAGKQEMLYRRVGANELDAIQICRGYVEAQHEYAMTKHDGTEVNQYAQRVISSPGTHDGLVWRNSDGSLGGPIAENIADALQQGYTDKAKPYHGYFFKILKGQGPAAPLGKLDFVVEGAMIGGFALAAAPADYRVTGVKSFIVGYDGIVYQKDLGPDTLKIFKDMELYNPDKSWSPTEDSWPAGALDASTSMAQE